jgi:hypothetical protein
VPNTGRLIPPEATAQQFKNSISATDADELRHQPEIPAPAIEAPMGVVISKIGHRLASMACSNRATPARVKSIPGQGAFACLPLPSTSLGCQAQSAWVALTGE